MNIYHSPWRITLNLTCIHCILQLNEIHVHAKCESNMYKRKHYAIYLYIWPLTLMDDLDLYSWPIKLFSVTRYTCMPNMKHLHELIQMLWPWPIYFTFDLGKWLWPWQFTIKNMQLYGIHPIAKYVEYTLSGSKVIVVLKSAIVCLYNIYSWPWPWRMTLTLSCYHAKRFAA